MRLRRFAPIWLAAPLVLLLFVWTWTETVEVSLQSAAGRCTAVLYGRSSTVDCPGLAGGRVVAVLIDDPPAVSLRRLLPPLWTDVVTGHGEEYGAGSAGPLDSPLPASFALDATLRRPTAPAGLVLLRPDGHTGWVFILDAANRRGAWWAWDGAPATPLQGIPLDRPLAQQARPLLRQLLSGWLGAAVLLLAGQLIGRATGDERRATREEEPATRRSSLATRRSLSVARRSSLVIIFFAFALALHVAIDVLEGAPHVQDSVTYLFQAQTLARGALTAPAPPLAQPDATPHFAQEFLLVRDGRWFGKYPPGYPAVLALGVLAGAPWLVNPLLAALTVSLLWRMTAGRRPRMTDHRSQTTDQGQSPTANVRQLTTNPLTSYLLNTDHCLLTTLLLATSPFFLIMSGSLMAHPAELFWTILFMLAWANTLSLRPSALILHPSTLLAGLALGALFLTRQFTALTIGLAYGGALGAMHFLKYVAPSGRMSRSSSEHAPRPGRCIARVGVAMLAALPLVLALPHYQAAVTGDARADPRLLYWPYDRVGFGPGVGEPENAFTMSLVDDQPAVVWYADPTQPPRGHSPARGLYNLSRNLDELETHLFGWPALFTLAFVWLAFLLRRPSAVDWVLLLTVLAVAGGYVAYWASGIAFGPRYFYAALPALIILTARGVSALAVRVGRRPVIILMAMLIGTNLAGLPARIESYRGYNFVSPAARQVIEVTAEAPALVFVPASDTDWWEYGAFFSGNTPWLDGPVIYARDQGAAGNQRLRAAFPERRAYLWDGTTLHYP